MCALNTIFKDLTSTILIVFTTFFYPEFTYSQNINAANEHILYQQQLQGEKIFFTKHKLVQSTVLGDIYYMDPNGSNQQQLTNFSDEFFLTERPEISSDGSKLVFCSNYNSWKSSNYVDAFIYDFQSNRVRRVTGYEKTTTTNETGTVNVTVSYPDTLVVSPSAIRISYKGCSNFVSGSSASLTVPANEEIWIKAEVSRGKGDIEIVTVPAGGARSVELNLTEGTLTVESCSPSPYGANVAVSINSETISQQGEAFPWYKILIWDLIQGITIAEAGGLRLGGDKHPAFSPDGTMLAVCTGELFSNSLAVLSTSNITANPKILVEGKRFFNQEFCGDPSWSPNNVEIVFTYTIINAWAEIESNLFKVSSNGGNPTQITFHSGNEIVSRPSYSPDGTKIAYSRLKSKSNSFTIFDLSLYNFESDIYVVTSNGGSSYPITNDGNAIDPSWGVVNAAVGIKENNKQMTENVSLGQNYPNPFNPKTSIEFTIPKTSYVSLKVYDLIGNMISVIVNETLYAGMHKVSFDGSNLPSGIYIYRLNTEHLTDSKKLLLLK